MRLTILIALAPLVLGTASCLNPAQERTVNAIATRDELTERNRKIVAHFAELFYARRDVATAFATYVADDYIQHNPGASDGRAAAVAMLTPMFSRGGARFHVKKIVVDGDMAVIHLHGIPVPGTPGVAVFDMYRLADGKIVEHWDAVQPVPAEAANAHPMF